MAFAEDLVNLIRQEVLLHLRQHKVALPARVVKYDPLTQKVDVQPEPADRDDTEDEDATFPQINGVRAMWARGGGASLTLPLKPGDRVDLLVQSAALDNWHASGGQVPQGEPRYGDLSDAVALVGLYPDSEALGAGLASDTDAILQPPTLGKLKLGSGATAGAARQGDTVTVTLDNTTIAAITAAQATLAAWIAGGSIPPPPPISIPATGTITGPCSLKTLIE